MFIEDVTFGEKKTKKEERCKRMKRHRSIANYYICDIDY